MLDFYHIPRLLAALLAVGLLILPLFRLPNIGMKGTRQWGVSILGTAAAHFLLIWFLSFVTAKRISGTDIFHPCWPFSSLGAE